MAYVDWEIDGPEIAACNCDYGCPCQFNALPTRGDCRAAFAHRIDKGRFGDVSLDGLAYACLLAWPGPIHEGGGEALPIVDERATEAQRNAILTIVSGAETEPGATMFNVFAGTFATMHEPLFRKVVFEADVAAATGRFAVDGIIEAAVEPIRNPVTGEAHRVSVHLPKGFEYREAQYASGTVKAMGTIGLDFGGRHAHLARLHMTPYGIVG